MDLDTIGIDVGSVVVVKMLGKTITVEVDGLGEKNGMPLIDFIDDNGNSRWAYLEQIESVIKY